jgi:hypothetical protein
MYLYYHHLVDWFTDSWLIYFFTILKKCDFQDESLEIYWFTILPFSWGDFIMVIQQLFAIHNGDFPSFPSKNGDFP